MYSICEGMKGERSGFHISIGSSVKIGQILATHSPEYLMADLYSKLQAKIQVFHMFKLDNNLSF